MLYVHGQSYVKSGSKLTYNPYHVAVTIKETINFLNANKQLQFYLAFTLLLPPPFVFL